MGGATQRSPSSVVEVDGELFWHGVKLGELWKTDMQVAIKESNRRKDVAFTVRMGKTGTSHPFQQPIPVDFARYNKNIYKESITLEGPTGQSWRTVIHACRSAMRFGKGWRRFSEENHLHEGYQLMFTLVEKGWFLVQFFDHVGRRLNSYPPLPDAQPAVMQTAAETESDGDLGFQQKVNGRAGASRRRLRLGRESQTSVAPASLSFVGTCTNSLNSDEHPKASRRRYGRKRTPEIRSPVPTLPHEHSRELEDQKFDARIGFPSIDDKKTEHLQAEAVRAANNLIYLDSGSDDDDDVLIYRPPATKSHVGNPMRNNPHFQSKVSLSKQPASHSRAENRTHLLLVEDSDFPSSEDDDLFNRCHELPKKRTLLNRAAVKIHESSSCRFSPT